MTLPLYDTQCNLYKFASLYSVSAVETTGWYDLDYIICGFCLKGSFKIWKAKVKIMLISNHHERVMFTENPTYEYV